MKKLWFTGLMCVLFLAPPAFGEVSLKNDTVPLPSVPGNYGAVMGTACIEGYLFVFGWGSGQLTMSGGTGVGVGIVQVYEERDGKVMPKKCSP
jgi:hypothetical protein